MNKKIILLGLILIVTIILFGCNTKVPKAPNNIDKDLWMDSVRVIQIIYKAYIEDNNFSVADENIIEQYFETYKGRQYNNNSEYIVINKVHNLYKSYKEYLFSKRTYSDENIVNQDKMKVFELFQELKDKYNSIANIIKN